MTAPRYRLHRVGVDEQGLWGFVAQFWPTVIDCTFHVVEVATYIDDVEQYRVAGTDDDFTTDLDRAEVVVSGVIGNSDMIHLTWGRGGSERGGCADLERMMAAVAVVVRKARELVGEGR